MTKTSIRLKKNTIYQYKGGGYVGCMWEWNFCLIDEKGELKDIMSSGYKGIQDGDKESLKDYIKNLETEMRPETKLYTYNIKKKKDMKELYNKCQADDVNTVYKFLFKNISEDYKQPCSMCLEKYNPEELISGVDIGYGKGYGGLAYGSGINYVCDGCVPEELER